MFEGGARRMHTPRSLACLRRVGERLRPLACRIRLIREFLQRWCSSLARELLKCRQYVCVQSAALAPEEVCIHRLSRQRMAKSEPILSVLHHELRRYQLLHDSQELAFVNVEHIL
jgi:hypothetical protein